MWLFLAVNQFNYLISISELIRNGFDCKYILKEIEFLQKVKSNAIVKYFKSWNDINDNHFIQMEFCSDNLKNILRVKHQFFGRKSDSIAMNAIEYYITSQLFTEIIECVQYLHEYNPPIIHRDLKPRNILFTMVNANKGRFIKICDFGLIKFHESADMSHTQDQGTDKYMAPEVKNSRHYDTKSDIYSLSIIGKELFAIDSNRDIMGENILLDKIIPVLRQMTRYDEYDSSVTNERPSCAQLLDMQNQWKINFENLNSRDVAISIMEFLENESCSISLSQYTKYHLKHV